MFHFSCLGEEAIFLFPSTHEMHGTCYFHLFIYFGVKFEQKVQLNRFHDIELSFLRIINSIISLIFLMEIFIFTKKRKSTNLLTDQNIIRWEKTINIKQKVLTYLNLIYCFILVFSQANCYSVYFFFYKKIPFNLTNLLNQLEQLNQKKKNNNSRSRTAQQIFIVNFFNINSEFQHSNIITSSIIVKKHHYS